MLEQLNLDAIDDLAGAQQALRLVLNLVEELKQENQALREQVQQLRDEIARLKGEQGRPAIKGNKKKAPDHSSERERKQRRPRRKRSKLDQIKIDREEVLPVDPRSLPPDAEFKGYETVVVQDVRLQTDNVRFLREKYDSPQSQQSYLAPLPPGYSGQFGPTVRALVIAFYYAAGMSESKIGDLLAQMGISISAGQISNLLVKQSAPWQAEAASVLQAGLASSDWQHLDETATRVDGVNHYCHVLCNPFYSWYATRPRKDRLTLIAVLQHTAEPRYLINRQTFDYLASFNVPQWAQALIGQWPHDAPIAQETIQAWLARDLAGRLNDQQQARVLEAAALSAYYAQEEVPLIPILLTDDASQFRHLSETHALCWIHEGRHYKKLTPFVPLHRDLLDDFLGEFWAYYHQLQQYRADPQPADAARLRQRFEELFTTETGYAALDKRIALTYAKGEQLLVVLDHPTLPLHNNPAELAARQRVRKRDVSFGPRTQEGVTAWDTFMSLAETTKKLGLSFYEYVLDRVAQRNAIPPLADLIRQQSDAATIPIPP
ncbi:MAG: transposase [Ardenticatenales bacterium]|nr:transposase [Ardenticatenales bacterium]